MSEIKNYLFFYLSTNTKEIDLDVNSDTDKFFHYFLFMRDFLPNVTLSVVSENRKLINME